MLSALGTGLHFEGATPYFTFVTGGCHFDVAGRANIDAGAATNADIRGFIIRRADFFIGTAGKQADSAYANDFLAYPNTGAA